MIIVARETVCAETQSQLCRCDSIGLHDTGRTFTAGQPAERMECSVTVCIKHGGFCIAELMQVRPAARLSKADLLCQSRTNSGTGICIIFNLQHCKAQSS